MEIYRKSVRSPENRGKYVTSKDEKRYVKDSLKNDRDAKGVKQNYRIAIGYYVYKFDDLDKITDLPKGTTLKKFGNEYYILEQTGHRLESENITGKAHQMEQFFAGSAFTQGSRSSKAQFLLRSEVSDEEFQNMIINAATYTYHLGSFRYAIDPSGIVTNAVSNQPVVGATTTLYYKGENGEEVLWDAGEYSQMNPLSTTVNGEYAWDVPEGLWKVKVSKDGYESTESDWLPVPPPQTDVHFKLKPLAYKLSYAFGEASMPTDVPTDYQTDVDTALPYPVRKGYTFAGWYEDENYSGLPYFNTLFKTAGDKVLYAKWEKATKVIGDDDGLAVVTVNGNDVSVVDSLQVKPVTDATISAHSNPENSFLRHLTVLNAQGEPVTLSEEVTVELAIDENRQAVKVLRYVENEARFEAVDFKISEDSPLVIFKDRSLGIYLVQYQTSTPQETRTVRQETRILTSDEVTYVDDPNLPNGQTREEDSVDGKLVVEITEIFVDGVLQDRREREVERVNPTPRKVFRGTGEFVKVPSDFPTVNEVPSASIETKVKQETRTLKSDEVTDNDKFNTSLDAQAPRTSYSRLERHLPKTSSKSNNILELSGLFTIILGYWGLLFKPRHKK